MSRNHFDFDTNARSARERVLREIWQAVRERLARR